MFLDPHFSVLAGGDVVEQLRARRSVLPAGDRSLTDDQRAVYAEGYRGAEVVETIHGWSVRSDTGLDGWTILARRLDSRARAVAWCVTWCAADPTRRYAWERKERK